MGEPPLDGANHVITISEPTNSVVGAVGIFGVYADRIVTSSEKSEKPNELRDCTLNL